jgi:REP element-mobilizing transposase RayT
MAIVHVVNRSVRRVFLMGEDRISGKNYEDRKAWIERRIEQLAACFGIDLLCFSILSNHVHLILRQRPDLVQSWDDTEVARRWLMLCPQKRNADGSPCEPTVAQLNSIRGDSVKLKEIRSRLSDISWWMRLMCQTIAQRINREDEATGHVWEARYRAVRLLDESALLACAAYVDLNPIRAAMAQTLEQSDYTSVQRRIQAFKQQVEVACLGGPSEIDQKTTEKPADRCLAPIHLDELRDALQVLPSQSGYRCSDRGFLNITSHQYIELLDWTARTLAAGKNGATPEEAPPVWQRLSLGLSSGAWLELVANFGKLFKLVAGKPHVVDQHRGVKHPKRFKLTSRARELLSSA